MEEQREAWNSEEQREAWTSEEQRGDRTAEEKKRDSTATLRPPEEITGDCTATLPYAIREEKTEEEMNGEDTTPCTTGEERGGEIRRVEKEMRR